MKVFRDFESEISKNEELQVGVFSSKSARKGAEATNAQIGFLMEFGVPTKQIPARSWLIMPIKRSINDVLDEVRKLKIAKKLKVSLLKAIGVKFREKIQKAFETSGFGTWAPNAPSTVVKKGSSMPLIDTGQLRKSVSSRVVKK